MILEGLMLALVGMGVVFIFLIILVFVIQISSKILAPYTAAELAQVDVANQARPDEARSQRTIAAIVAAIALHRSVHRK